MNSIEAKSKARLLGGKELSNLVPGDTVLAEDLILVTQWVHTAQL